MSESERFAKATLEYPGSRYVGLSAHCQRVLAIHSLRATTMSAGAVDEQFHAINPEVAAWSESYYFVRDATHHTARLAQPCTVSLFVRTALENSGALEALEVRSTVPVPAPDLL